MKRIVVEKEIFPQLKKRLSTFFARVLATLGLKKNHSVPPDSPPPVQAPISHARPKSDAHRTRVSAPRSVEQWKPSMFDVSPAEGKTRFHDLGLPDQIMHAIADLGFAYCTPIQAEILPKILAGVDASGKAQTGTGKTAAFLITIFTHLLCSPTGPKRKRGAPRVLIMAPTRELVIQIEKEARVLSTHLRCSIIAVFGGMDYKRQKSMLADKIVDIIIATPGRLIDFMRQKDVHLDSVQILVIDEADRMLDMGFIPDMRRIVTSTPPKSKRQTMLFSATLTPEVTRLASAWTKDAVTVDVASKQVSVAAIDQKVFITTTAEKFTLLYNFIEGQHLERVIVFANRRDEARRVFEKLSSHKIKSGLLSGEVTQRERIRTLESLREGEIRVLVATDVAARGLHIEGVSHVINYNLPLDPEDYIHRIGRTGRAGAEGTSVSFADEQDGVQIPVIEQFIGRPLASVYPDDAWLTPLPSPSGAPGKVHAEKRTHQSSQGPRRGGSHQRRTGPRKRY